MKVISGGQFLHVKLIYIDKVNEDELGLRLSPYRSSLGTLTAFLTMLILSFVLFNTNWLNTKQQKLILLVQVLSREQDSFVSYIGKRKDIADD